MLIYILGTGAFISVLLMPQGGWFSHRVFTFYFLTFLAKLLSKQVMAINTSIRNVQGFFHTQSSILLWNIINPFGRPLNDYFYSEKNNGKHFGEIILTGLSICQKYVIIIIILVIAYCYLTLLNIQSVY